MIIDKIDELNSYSIESCQCTKCDYIWENYGNIPKILNPCPQCTYTEYNSKMVMITKTSTSIMLRNTHILRVLRCICVDIRKRARNRVLCMIKSRYVESNLNQKIIDLFNFIEELDEFRVLLGRRSLLRCVNLKLQPISLNVAFASKNCGGFAYFIENIQIFETEGSIPLVDCKDTIKAIWDAENHEEYWYMGAN